MLENLMIFHTNNNKENVIYSILNDGCNRTPALDKLFMCFLGFWFSDCLILYCFNEK